MSKKKQKPETLEHSQKAWRIIDGEAFCATGDSPREVMEKLVKKVPKPVDGDAGPASVMVSIGWLNGQSIGHYEGLLTILG
jgi:hypothetical protein